MEEFVVSERFCHGIQAICNRKMHEIDPESVEKCKLSNFCRFNAISEQFPRQFMN